MTKKNAINILKDENLDFDTTLMLYSETMYEIRVGVFTSREDAKRIADALNKLCSEL